MKLKENVRKTRDGTEEMRTYCAFLRDHGAHICTNNVIERLNRKIHRRARVVDCFPDGNSALMPAGTRLRHAVGFLWSNKKYRSIEARADFL